MFGGKTGVKFLVEINRTRLAPFKIIFLVRGPPHLPTLKTGAFKASPLLNDNGLAVSPVYFHRVRTGTADGLRLYETAQGAPKQCCIHVISYV